MRPAARVSHESIIENPLQIGRAANRGLQGGVIREGALQRSGYRARQAARLACYGSAVLCLGIVALILSFARAPAVASASNITEASAVVVLLASNEPAYQPGMVATFTIAVDNSTNAPLTMTFPAAQLYDVVVLAEETEVWRWSADRVFADVITERSFPPGLTLLGRVTWDWRDTAGAPLPPGTYRAVGSLASSPPRAGNVLEVSLSAP